MILTDRGSRHSERGLEGGRVRGLTDDAMFDRQRLAKHRPKSWRSGEQHQPFLC